MKYLSVTKTDMTKIADAIREKTGKAGSMTLEQMPLEIANIQSGGGDGSPRVVENVVNIAAIASVMIEKHDEAPKTRACYNNTRTLPSLPVDVLAQYPYAWIRTNETSGYFDLLFAKGVWYAYGQGTPDIKHADSEVVQWYRVSISDSDMATEWTFYKEISSANFGLDYNMTVLWSLHDIPNGSATATTIYFYGSEPVPID